jgi:hypothetical protein
LFGSFLPSRLVGQHHQLYSGIGADIVMESITLIDPLARVLSVMAFHEKAGRCQVLFALISIFSFLPGGIWAERPGAVKGALGAA